MVLKPCSGWSCGEGLVKAGLQESRQPPSAHDNVLESFSSVCARKQLGLPQQTDALQTGNIIHSVSDNDHNKISFQELIFTTFNNFLLEAIKKKCFRLT